ncbi:MAG: ABC transporter ATP-binding protein, partial [Alphaproteobacteria bacterium]
KVAFEIRRGYADFLNERFRAWRLIKLANSLPAEVRRADAIQARVVANQLHFLRISGLMALIFVPVMSAFLLAILYTFVEILALDVATIVIFILIMIRLMPISQALQKQLSTLANFAPSFERIDETLNRAARQAEKLDLGRTISHVTKGFSLERVSFRYPDRETFALSNVSLSIPAGKMTALIGPSGSGKSTLVDLLPRIIDPAEGRILIDGVLASEFSLRSLRSLIAYVPQEPFLFDASFADNIRYLREEASDLEVMEAARLANAADFIECLPQGYATSVGDAGAKLSGGQKQRIVLARAFLSRAEVLILDEPTSALDYASEAAIQRAIEEMRRKVPLTVIVIAHRLSTVQNADLVIHLRDGKLVRVGPAGEILSRISESERKIAVSAEQADIK